ncbi:ATP synthase subunit b [Candidatus Photodesmus blepharus]|uniref:ATP synthase subunit b n=1 Tax=Candidatus Photodesmus blepharonis TaxID=1179155 RepID=A0A084CNN8_9GAMM|nr:F0F1 ATP synthase subunit B [Candidatus Photodesmus blepharus]KEY91417.1 ATP synthase subunit b [Candidatus Photodesmus blepharus]
MNMNATIFGQAVSFAMFVLFCMKYVWPPIIQAIEERQKEISNSLLDAKRAAQELDLAKLEASSKIEEAKQTAAKLLEQANERGAQIVAQACKEAKMQKKEMLLQTKAEIEVERVRLLSELQKQVAALAIFGAEKILKRTIDDNEQNDILNSIINKL